VLPVRTLFVFGFSFLCLTLLTVAHAQRAADSAQNYPATSGSGIWNAGDNFGFGFQPWQFVTAGSAGMFLGDSTQNGGNGLGNPGSSGGINSANLRSWGLFANSGGTADALRPFQTVLAVGETFSVDFDNGFIQNDGVEGIGLKTADGIGLWQFSFSGGQNVYRVFDQRGLVDTSLPFTADGIHIDFTLTSTTTYSATITLASGPLQTITGGLANAGAVAQFDVFDLNGGFNSSNNAYANNLAIVPEPGSVALLLAGAVLGIVRSRRQWGR
jgi:hypothetical protein